jgi:hypothetical protein
MPLLNLPVDVWFAIMEHLSLADLTSLYIAFATSTAPIDVSVIRRLAVNVISRILAVDTCTAMPTFSDNKLCYKFRMTYPRAEECCHRDDDGSNPPCGGGVYDPTFSDSMEFSRTLRSDPNDTTTTDMTIVANDGKPFGSRSMHPLISLHKNTGPTELIWAYVDFHTSPTEYLRFDMNTFEVDIEEPFIDVPHSPTCVVRTVSHHVPLRNVMWVEWIEGNQKVTDLPKEWYEFWSESGMRAVSTFKKEQITFTHHRSGKVVNEWQWKLESFKIEWKIPMPVLSETWKSIPPPQFWVIKGSLVAVPGRH